MTDLHPVIEYYLLIIILIHVIIHMCTIVHVNILNVIQSIDWKRLESAVMLESPINN